jgi:hypothetical protein
VSHDLDAVLRRTGCTYRQLDYWTRRGWLHPTGGTGTGTRRVWPQEEIRVARTMRRLVEVGLIPAAAAVVARGKPGAAVALAPGIVIEVRP